MTPEHHCLSCGLKALCFPPQLSLAAVDQIAAIVGQPPALSRGDTLYRAGDPRTALYAVRSGHFKTVWESPDGAWQVTGFYQPGEVMGLDHLGQATCQTTAIALERSQVCALPAGSLTTLSHALPELQGHLFRLLSTELSTDHQRAQQLITPGIDQRLSLFLWEWSERRARRQNEARTFRLPMSRADLAAHLGTTVESISRAFAQLQREGLLEVHSKDITLCQREALQARASARCRRSEEA